MLHALQLIPPTSIVLIGTALLLAMRHFRWGTRLKPKWVVCGFGHPLLDITSHVDHVFLQRYGLHPADTVIAKDDHKNLSHELLQRADVEVMPGGATLNAIRACRWMLPLSENHYTFYVGCIGTDDFGEILTKAVCDSKVEAVLHPVHGFPTGSCACMIYGKDRCLVAEPGAAKEFSTEMYKLSRVHEIMSMTDIFYFAGFFINVNNMKSTDDATKVPALYLAEYAHRYEKLLCGNLSAPYLCSDFCEQWTELFPYLDIIFGNETDFTALAQALNWEVTSTESIAQQCVRLPKLRKRTSRIIIITRGSRSTIVCTSTNLRRYKTPKVARNSITDTNGAGDAFVGGFLSEFMCGSSINRCIRAAQYSALEVVKRKGCTFPNQPKFRYTFFHLLCDSLFDFLYGKLE